jgi:outer membrane protein TolC
VQQAQRAYQIANVRFTNGVSTQLELSDARLSLQQAEANRTQAARDLQVARARVALLPNLPVAPAGGVPLRAPQVVPQTPSVPAQPQGGTEIRNAAIQGPQRQVGIQ